MTKDFEGFLAILSFITHSNLSLDISKFSVKKGNITCLIAVLHLKEINLREGCLCSLHGSKLVFLKQCEDQRKKV